MTHRKPEYQHFAAHAALAVAITFVVAAPSVAQTTSGAAPSAPASAASAPAAAPAARGPSLELALEAAQVALQACAARQQRIGVTVVDSAGVTKVQLASDGASPRGVQSSAGKAATALSFQAPTSQLGQQATSDGALAARLAANPAFNSRAGGVLLKAGDTLIGAVGVGGARGSEVDEACALAGVERIQARLQ